MLKSLMVPLDGSEFSESSLPLASQVAGATGARLHLVHVHVPYEPEQLLANTPFHFEGVTIEEYDAHRLEQDEEYLASLARRFNGDTPCVEARVLHGHRVADTLATHAAAVAADMVFIASHGHTGVSRFWLGSVADELVRHSTIPLLVTRPTEEEGGSVSSVGHVLVPLDGSDLAEEILRPATDLARATGARLTLAHVVSVATILGPRIVPLSLNGFEPELEGANTYLEGVASGLRQGGLEVSTQAVQGKAPALAIADLARELKADVIAMATHGYGGVRRTLLGSVADKLLRISPLPVLIVRPQASA